MFMLMLSSSFKLSPTICLYFGLAFLSKPCAFIRNVMVLVKMFIHTGLCKYIQECQNKLFPDNLVLQKCVFLQLAFF